MSVRLRAVGVVAAATLGIGLLAIPHASPPAAAEGAGTMTIEMAVAANELEDTGVLDGEITRTWVAETATLRIVVHDADVPGAMEAVSGSSMPELFEIVGSPYTNAQLQSEMSRIVGSRPAEDMLVVSASPYVDTGAGLKVGVFTEGVATEDAGARLAATEVSALSAALDVSVPVTFVRDEPQTSGIGRQEADLPISGGARMYNTDGGACSTGIGYMRYDQSDPLHEYQAVMLTADHCGESGDTWETDGAGTIGTMQSFYSGGADLKWIIHPETYADYSDAMNIFQPRIYTGSYTSATHAPVYGSITPAFQMEVCYSGSYSGTVCGAEVGAVNTTYLSIGGPGGIVYTNGARTSSASNNAPFGNGDSGGAVYMPLSGVEGPGGVVVGIGSSFNGVFTDPCLGVPSGGGRACSSDVYFAAEGALSNRLPDGYGYLFSHYDPIPPFAPGDAFAYEDR